MTQTLSHIPVMCAEVVAALSPHDGGLYIDGTFGRGGYTRALLNAANASVVGIDRDPAAMAAGETLVRDFAPRLRLIHGAFGDMLALLARLGIEGADGVTLDLGVSSPQLDDATRGFSFAADGPLDMRMSLSGRSAADLVNEEREEALADIIFHFGEERYARRVARRIVAARAETPIKRTAQLAAIVRAAVPPSKDGLDPATRTFQALRIAVNDELGELTRGLAAAEKLLRPGGRLAVVSFHSLEDRAVKTFLRAKSPLAPRASRHVPANDSFRVKPTFRLMSNKPHVPSAQEVAANPRARSARLRVAERTEALVPEEIVA